MPNVPLTDGAIPQRITDRESYRRFLALDLEAHDLRRWRLLHRFTKPTLLYQRALRSTEYWQTKHGALKLVYYWRRFVLLRLSLKTGITISPGTFGPGLSIPHYGSVIVNSRARVGAFCRIHSSTNIGAFRGGAPVMGDRIYIGPGAVLFGPIRIGNDVAVGANATVMEDVPDNSTVVGAKARVLPADPGRSVLQPWLAHYAPSDQQRTLADSGN